MKDAGYRVFVCALLLSAGLLSSAQAQVSDTTPPTVAITSPADGATVSGTITVTASASDNVGVVGVQFQYNGIDFSDPEDTTPPYTATGYTNNVPNGPYTLTAIARDAAGNRTTSAPVTVTVANDTTPPTVAITSPASGATVSGTITVTADASDNVGVVGVQFQYNGTNFGPEDTAAPYSADAHTNNVPDGTYTLTAVARDAAGNLTTSAPVTVTVANVSNGVGQWSGLVSLPIVPIHMSLLPDGSVLAWGNPATPPSDAGAQVRVWDPTVPRPALQEVPNPFVDVYCSGHAFLADGRLLVTGGHLGDHVGSDLTAVFDFRTRTWSNGPRMSAARWYPTNTTLANGEVAVVSGAIAGPSNVNTLPEVWNAASGVRPLNGAQLALPLYPWMHLAPNGQLFNSGPGQTTRYLDTSGTGSWTTVALTNFGDRQQYAGASVMYEPGKVLILGGSQPPTTTAEVIDLNAAVPQWQFTSSMAHPRRYPNATLLPDGKVLVTGGTGGTTSGISDVLGAVFPAEMWDPATGAWTTLAAMSVRRMYHSTAVLLPDGRVLTAGGGGLTLSDDGNHYDAEYYSPPYLFKGARPVVSSAPASAGYGQSFVVGTPNAAAITKVTLVGLSSSTHEFNMTQRFVALAFARTADGTGLAVTVPTNPNIAPPGYYMLFILNSAGVPSVAKMVRIG